MRLVYSIITDADPERFSAKVTAALNDNSNKINLIGQPFVNPGHFGGLCQAVVQYLPDQSESSSDVKQASAPVAMPSGEGEKQVPQLRVTFAQALDEASARAGEHDIGWMDCITFLRTRGAELLADDHTDVADVLLLAEASAQDHPVGWLDLIDDVRGRLAPKAAD